MIGVQVTSPCILLLTKHEPCQLVPKGRFHLLDPATKRKFGSEGFLEHFNIDPIQGIAVRSARVGRYFLHSGTAPAE